VHVAVIDPSVGSGRRAIAVQTTNGFFVGPDNGLISWALAREKIKTIRLLEKRQYFREPVSLTFHGRDIFAPVAAHLSRGLSAHRLGRELKDFIRLPWPQSTNQRSELRGEVVYIGRASLAL
jgi:S-adenosylmethionine hydrolase